MGSGSAAQACHRPRSGGRVRGGGPRYLRAPTRRSPRAAFARQVAMYLAHVVCGLSLTEVGTMFARTGPQLPMPAAWLKTVVTIPSSIAGSIIWSARSPHSSTRSHGIETRDDARQGAKFGCQMRTTMSLGSRINSGQLAKGDQWRAPVRAPERGRESAWLAQEPQGPKWQSSYLRAAI
jgi:hypothetical protein